MTFTYAPFLEPIGWLGMKWSPEKQQWLAWSLGDWFGDEQIPIARPS